MFNKKQKETARKVEVKHDNAPAQEIKINRIPDNTCGVAPLVSIEKHESRINGKPQRPTYRVSIGGRDVLTLSPREYQELFVEMLRHKDADELMHDIADVHMEEHEEVSFPKVMLTTKGAEELIRRELGAEGIAEIIKALNRD